GRRALPRAGGAHRAGADPGDRGREGFAGVASRGDLRPAGGGHMSRARGIDALLTHQIGLDPSTVGSSLIARGLQSRMSGLGVSSRQDYGQLRRSSGEELQKLIEEIVVPESWFFRDDRPFAFLREQVVSRWLVEPDQPTLRVLSLPCAGGEEPYSIAMTLLD